MKWQVEAGSSNGTGGMLTKLKAATIATMAGVPVYICSSLKEQPLIEAAENQGNGTFFTASAKNMKTQKQWLAFYLLPVKALSGWIEEQAQH